MTKVKDLFLLDPKITYLNHGSFGACPKPIFDDYQLWQRKLEQEPLQFILDRGTKALDHSRQALARYVNCDPLDLVFMPNPTTAMNTVIKSLDLKNGDEILTTDQEYGAIERTWKYYCNKKGAKYINQKIELPLTSKEAFITQLWKGVTARTKIIFFSQITSSTALIFPAKEICKKAKEEGIMVIVDGAHVPGHIPLDIKDLDCDIYTGANHKWLLTPKGNSFLFVKKDLQNAIDPLIISWGYQSEQPSNSQFQDYHQYNGTRDFSSYLTIPAALNFFKDHNWEERKATCRQMLQHYYPIISDLLNTKPLAPLNDDFLGQISSIPISTSNPAGLKKLLYDKYKIEIPVMTLVDDIYLRISFQAYNSETEIETLINALNDILKTSNLIEINF